MIPTPLHITLHSSSVRRREDQRECKYEKSQYDSIHNHKAELMQSLEKKETEEKYANRKRNLCRDDSSMFIKIRNPCFDSKKKKKKKSSKLHAFRRRTVFKQYKTSELMIVVTHLSNSFKFYLVKKNKMMLNWLQYFC